MSAVLLGELEPNTPEWDEVRSRGIGGSEIAAALGFYAAAAILLVPLAFHMGGAHMARKSGVGMVRGGMRRIRTGRL